MSDNLDNIVTAKQAKRSAKIFNYGTILSVLIPFPLFIFWFGASMFVYSMFRHHPNKKVGDYTQTGAYIYYTLAGLFVPVLTFAPKSFFVDYWWALWGGAILGVIPICIYQIIKANSEEWQDTEIKKESL